MDGQSLGSARSVPSQDTFGRIRPKERENGSKRYNQYNLLQSYTFTFFLDSYGIIIASYNVYFFPKLRMSNSFLVQAEMLYGHVRVSASSLVSLRHAHLGWCFPMLSKSVIYASTSVAATAVEQWQQLSPRTHGKNEKTRSRELCRVHT